MLREYFRPLGTGDILDGAFQIYRKAFASLFLTALILFVPVALFTPYSTSMASVDFTSEVSSAWILGFFLIMMLSVVTVVVIWPALVREIDQLLHGRPVSVGDGIKVGLRKALPLLVSGFLIFVGVSMIMMALFIPLAFVLAAFGAVAGGSEPSVLTTILIFGFVLLVYAAVIVAVASLLYGVVPAMVVEGAGPIQAIVRSVRLSKGRKLRIVVVIVVAWLIQSLPTFAVAYFSGAFAGLADPTAAATMSGTQIAIQSLGSFIVGALTYPYMIATIVLLYYDGRVRLEGYDLEVASQGLVEPEADPV